MIRPVDELADIKASAGRKGIPPIMRERAAAANFIRKRHTLYDGSHVREPGTEVLRTRRAIAISESTVLLEVDGESVGRLPAQLDVLAGALRLKV